MSQAKAQHACAILLDRRGWLLLQLRPATAGYAPSRLTCFGGKAEHGESADACLMRELQEELGWRPEAWLPAVDLLRGGDWLARFSVAQMPDDADLHIEAGSVAIWAPAKALDGLPLSPWHAAVLRAWQRGLSSIDLLDRAWAWATVAP